MSDGPAKDLDLRLVAGLAGSTGLVMGLVTSLVGIPANIEAFVWVAGYVVWVVVVERRGVGRPFVHVLLTSLATGILTSVVQLALFDAYRAHNPDYTGQLAGLSRAEAARGMVLQGLLVALAMGLVVGGIAALRQRRP